ncbi:MAG: STAS domain-containing protein [Planctomycetota bacterium]|nr:STAS domain-containing protein [Planctomycetota bacterium]
MARNAPSSKDLVIGKEVLAADGIVLLRLDGSLSSYTFDQLENTIQEAFQSGMHKIIVDAGGIDYVSSAGAGVLMNAFLQAQDHHGKIIVMNLSVSMRETFNILNLTSVIPLAANREEALALAKGA